MSIHKLEDGTCVIGAGGMWLPGCYEDERTARFAFRVPDEVKAKLRDNSIARGDGVITWGDIAKAREELRAPNDRTQATAAAPEQHDETEQRHAAAGRLE